MESVVEEYRRENADYVALWRAVVLQALADACLPNPHCIFRRRARAWIEGGGAEFLHVCQLAALDARRVRQFQRPEFSDPLLTRYQAARKSARGKMKMRRVT